MGKARSFIEEQCVYAEKESKFIREHKTIFFFFLMAKKTPDWEGCYWIMSKLHWHSRSTARTSLLAFPLQEPSFFTVPSNRNGCFQASSHMPWLLSFPPAIFSNSIHSVRSGCGPQILPSSVSYLTSGLYHTFQHLNYISFYIVYYCLVIFLASR